MGEWQPEYGVVVPSKTDGLDRQFPNQTVKCSKCGSETLWAKFYKDDAHLYVQCAECSLPIAIVCVER